MLKAGTLDQETMNGQVREKTGEEITDLEAMIEVKEKKQEEIKTDIERDQEEIDIEKILTGQEALEEEEIDLEKKGDTLDGI